MPKGLFVDVATGQRVERDLTAEEIAAITESDADRIARLIAETEANRRAAFAAEADSLFFEWQRGEGTEQTWRDKVEEIRQRYPYPS